MKTKLLASLILCVSLLCSTVQSAYADNFFLGFFWAPPADQTNDVQYDYIQDAHITHPMNVVGTSINTVTENTYLLDKSAARGLKGIVADDRLLYLDSLSDAEIDAFANDYKNHSAIGGYYVRDEPMPARWEGFARAYNRFLYHSPNSIPYANLFPTYADTYTQLEVPTEAISQTVIGSGNFVSSAVKLGQTFVTPSNMEFINAVELYLDTSQWGSNEGLTLTLWDSEYKTARYAYSKKFKTSSNPFVKFDLMTEVTPNTSYYWELTHDGGGDNSVGWVTRSTVNAYTSGKAYINGAGQGWDFYFKVFSGQTERLNSPIVQTNQDSGHYVNSTNRLGQTFRTTYDMNDIDFIELTIDYNNWSTTELLTLTLWDSPAKTTQIASDTRSFTNNGSNVRFSIKQPVTPNTSYYWELTHNGGGDDSVGLVHSAPVTNVFDMPNATAYINGVQQNFDFTFKVFRSATPVKLLAASQTVQGDSETVTDTSRIGQTFTTSSDTTVIDYFELLIYNDSWLSGSSLTLKLWDSPAKTVQIGSTATLSESNNFQDPQFVINAAVMPNTSYYWEVTHNGGTGSSVSLASSSADELPDADAYMNGAALSKDIVFKAYGEPKRTDHVVAQRVVDSGRHINSVNSMGQTFKTPANLQRVLQFIELNIDYSTWAADETLTLTVYDGTAKNQIMGKASLNQTNNGTFPRFYLNTQLKPDTTYYYEVTHNGGGNNSIGWVTHSSTDVYADGAGYVGGVAQSWDMYFRSVFSSFYSDYLEEWVDTVGPNSLKYLSFDHYPFKSGITPDYFLNLELIRDMGIRKNVRTHMFAQSVGIIGSMVRPNENQLRWNVYTGLAYGIKGLSWFTWSTPEKTTFLNGIIDRAGNKTDLYEPVKNLNEQISVLGTKLLDLTSRKVYHSGALSMGTQGVPQNFFWKPASASDDLIVSYFQDSNNRKYIMIVNKSTANSGTFSFNVNPKPAEVKEISKVTGMEVATNYNASTGVLSGTFLPGEGKLYALPAGY